MSDPLVSLLRSRGHLLREQELDLVQGKLAELSTDERREVEAITANIVEGFFALRVAELTADQAAALRYLFALEEAA